MEIFNDSEHHAVSLRNLSFLFEFVRAFDLDPLKIHDDTSDGSSVITLTYTHPTPTNHRHYWKQYHLCPEEGGLGGHPPPPPPFAETCVMVALRASTNWESQCIAVCSTRLLSTWSTSVPVSDIPSRRHLRSATRRHLTVPRHRLSNFGRWTFRIAGPTVWNSLLDISLRDSALTSNSFRQSLKTNLFHFRRYHSAHTAQ